MIGKIISILAIVAIIVVLFLSLSSKQQMVVVYEGNIAKTPIAIKLNHFQDSDCGMVIEDITYASQVVAPDGKTWFFHDHGGMVNWLNRKQFKEDVVIWVYAKDAKEWIDGRKAYYSCTDITPMEYGFGAYKKAEKNFIDFETMRLRVLRGETLRDPYIRKRLLGK